MYFIHTSNIKVYFKSASACEKVFPKKSELNRTVHISMLKKLKTAWECITCRRHSSWYQFKMKVH